MSAFLVNDNHLNVLVSYFASPINGKGLWCEVNGEWGYLTPENASQVAYELHRENVRSVDYRYSEANGDEEYKFQYIRHAADEYKPEEIAGALDCLEYQSCERDDYHGSKAYKYIIAMRKHLLNQIAERKLGDETFWEINDVRPARYQYITDMIRSK